MSFKNNNNFKKVKVMYFLKYKSHSLSFILYLLHITFPAYIGALAFVWFSQQERKMRFATFKDFLRNKKENSK